jgi:archaellum component FlaG (FlaF/FlaG flagellin family)
MKKIIILFFALACFASCGKQTYSTQSQGKDNVSFVKVLTEGAMKYADNSVIVVVDGVEYPYGKVEKVKKKVKARSIAIEPGKHKIKVVVDGETAKDENVFLGLQESKVFILK